MRIILILFCSLGIAKGQAAFSLLAVLNATAVAVNCDSANDADLKAYYKFDEAGGNAIDDKGANDLTDTLTVLSNVGKIGGSREFSSATGNYFTIADNADLSGADIDLCFAAWVKYGATLGGGNYPSVAGKYGAAGNREWLLYENGDNQRYEFVVSGDGTALTTVTANTFGDPSDNVWHWIVVWHDATANTINIQIDNTAADSAAHTTGVFNSTAAFQIGANNGSFTWTGHIDEALFTKRKLTADEKTALFSVCRPSGL